jgi:Dolichyl-phosphate-mannose-protein mannosyltransferase
MLSGVTGMSRRGILFVLGLALFLRLGYCLFVFAPLLENKGEELGWAVDGKLAVDPYDAIARNILAGKGYVDETGRRNLERLPLYPYFLVLIYKLFGSELWKLQVVQSLLDTMSCFLIFRLSLKTFRDPTPAVLAAGFYAVYFKMIVTVARPETETLYIFLLLVFLLVFIGSFARSALAFFSGIALGLVTLIKPITLLFPLAAAGLYLFRARARRGERILLLAVGFLVTILPHLMNNYLREGRLFYSSGGGKMLYMGAVIDYSKNFREEEARLIREINSRYSFSHSLEDDHVLGRMAVRSILKDPWAFLKRLAFRICLFWTYPDYSTTLMALKTILILLFNGVLLLLAALGFWLSGRRKYFYEPFLLLFLYVYSAYVITYAYSRYSLPLFPVLFIFSSYEVVHLVKTSGSLRRKLIPGKTG